MNSHGNAFCCMLYVIRFLPKTLRKNTWGQEGDLNVKNPCVIPFSPSFFLPLFENKGSGPAVAVCVLAGLFERGFSLLLRTPHLAAIPSDSKRSKYKLKKECSPNAYTQELSKQKAATPVGIEQVYQCPGLCPGSSAFVSWNVPMKQSGAVGAWQPA